MSAAGSNPAPSAKQNVRLGSLGAADLHGDGVVGEVVDPLLVVVLEVVASRCRFCRGRLVVDGLGAEQPDRAPRPWSATGCAHDGDARPARTATPHVAWARSAVSASRTALQALLDESGARTGASRGVLLRACSRPTTACSRRCIAGPPSRRLGWGTLSVTGRRGSWQEGDPSGMHRAPGRTEGSPRRTTRSRRCEVQSPCTAQDSHDVPARRRAGPAALGSVLRARALRSCSSSARGAPRSTCPRSC